MQYDIDHVAGAVQLWMAKWGCSSRTVGYATTLSTPPKHVAIVVTMHPPCHTLDIIAEHFRQYPKGGRDWEPVDYEIICSDIDSGGYVIGYYAPILPTGVNNFDSCFVGGE